MFENDNELIALFLALAQGVSFKKPSFSVFLSIIRKMGLWDM